MNKKIFSRRFLLIFLASIALCAVTLIIAIELFQTKLTSSYSDSKTAELKILVRLVSSDILIGNYKNARQKMVSSYQTGGFSSYEVRDLKNSLIDHYPETPENFFENENYIKFEIPILFSDDAPATWGTVRFFVSKETLVKYVHTFTTFGLMIMLVALVVVLSGFVIYFYSVNNWVNSYSENFQLVLNGKAILNIKSENPWRDSVYAFHSLQAEKIKQSNELQHLREQNIFSELAKQVAHDIRSPLAALEMISSDFKSLPEDTRVITRNAINRIRDITNSLSKGPPANLDKELEKLEATNILSKEICLLTPIVDSVVSEKRTQYRDKFGVSIVFDYSSESYGLFAEFNIVELQRVISNIINNAVEALPNQKGIVEVFLKKIESEIVIQIKDDGVGIPSPVINQIRITSVTFNKEGGSGLGLTHAKSVLAQLNGRLDIESDVGKGTIVSLFLPTGRPPSWFIPYIQLNAMTVVIIVDDDQSIHELWADRLHSCARIHLTSPDSLRKYYRENFADLDNVKFLIDYEFINSSITGLDLIEELNIGDDSTLVTSHYEEIDIQSRCDKNHVKLLPKSMSGFVPIRFT